MMLGHMKCSKKTSPQKDYKERCRGKKIYLQSGLDQHGLDFYFMSLFLIDWKNIAVVSVSTLRLFGDCLYQGWSPQMGKRGGKLINYIYLCILIPKSKCPFFSNNFSSSLCPLVDKNVFAFTQVYLNLEHNLENKDVLRSLGNIHNCI